MKDNPLILSTKLLAPRHTEQAAAGGIRMECVPFIRTVPLPPDTIGLSPFLQQPHTVVFSSANAVAAVSAALKGSAPPWTIACLEGGTLQSVQQHLPSVPVTATAPDGLSLARHLVRMPGIASVLFFCGDIRLPVLPQTLRAAGIAVQELEVYQTVETPQALPGPWDGILFFSPSAVRSFFSVHQPRSGTVFFAIGGTTAAALPAGAHPVVLSPKPDAGSLIDTVLHYFGAAKHPATS